MLYMYTFYHLYYFCKVSSVYSVPRARGMNWREAKRSRTIDGLCNILLKGFKDGLSIMMVFGIIYLFQLYPTFS